MPAIGNRGPEKGPAQRPAPKPRPEAKPKPNIGPWKGKLGPQPKPTFTPPPKPASKGPLSPTLQKTFAPLGKQVGAPSKLAPPSQQKYGAQTGRTFLGSVGHFISSGLESAYPHGIKEGSKEAKQLQHEGRFPGATVTPGTGTAAGGFLGKKAQAVGLAFAQDPIGTTRHTFTSIPPTLNAFLTGTGRLIGESVKGHPDRAVKELAHSIAHEYSVRYGGLNKPGGIAADAHRMEREGVIPEATDALMALSLGGGAVGKLATAGIKGSGAIEDFAKVLHYREAVTHALQHADTQKFLRNPDVAGNPVPSLPKPTKLERSRAFLYESTQPRPSLRSAPGIEPQAVRRGAAVRPQSRAPTLFRGMTQTAIDNARRAYQQQSLAKVVHAQQEFHAHPEQAGYGTPYATQLAYDTRRAEVAPRIQSGGIGQFFGAGKQQRIGAAYAKGEQVRARQGEGSALQKTFAEHLKDATPEQKKILVLAKEGLIPLHDPVKAHEWLREIAAQANEGSRGGSLIPLVHRMTGSDVHREVGSVVKYMDKHGPASVITPQFEALVRSIPDERLTAPRDPGLQADTIVARRYLPQQLTLHQWATRHPDSPLAKPTQMAVEQVHRLLEEGKQLKAEGYDSLASDKFVFAKNLADQNARAHGLPTDRAYIEHTSTLDRGHYLHTVGVRSPADYKLWKGQLQKMGYRSTDADLILRGMLKNIRHDYNMRFVNKFDERFGLGPRNMTVKEARDWLARSGRNPQNFVVGHMGKLRESIAERMNGTDHLTHLDADPEALEHSMGRMVDEAAHVHGNDALKGARIYPATAWNELHGGLTGSKFAPRLIGNLKAKVSKEMLGFFNLPWVTTMSTMTYPIQSLMAGAGPLSLREAFKWYRSKSPGEQHIIDNMFGVDSRFLSSSHGYIPERLGAAMPHKLENLAAGLRLVKGSPIGQALKKGYRIDEALLKLERIPRRWARINAAYKGVRTEALNQMWQEMQGVQREQTHLEAFTNRAMHFGRMPEKEYLDRAMKQVPVMERHAMHLDQMMGEWHQMTQFERNYLNRMVMFYPWVRYSLKLVTQTLPVHHPIVASIMAKLGSMDREQLRQLLGTDPPVGNLYFGKEQPQTPAAQRKFQAMGIRQANPTLNAVMDILGGSPGQVTDVMPPYLTALLDWAVGKNLFTDKALKGAGKGEASGIKEGRPQFLPYMAAQATQPFAPTRTLNDVLTAGRPQSAESVFGSAPAQYGKAFTKTLDKQAAQRRKEGILPTFIKRELPIFPHGDQGELARKIESEERKTREKNPKKKKASGWNSSGSGWESNKSGWDKNESGYGK